MSKLENRDDKNYYQSSQKSIEELIKDVKSSENNYNSLIEESIHRKAPKKILNGNGNVKN